MGNASFPHGALPRDVIQDRSETVDAFSDGQASRGVHWWDRKRAKYVLSRMAVHLTKDSYGVSVAMVEGLDANRLKLKSCPLQSD
jgi:hypothetical protein